LFKDTYVVELGELEIRGYYDPKDGSGGLQELCSDNVLTNLEVSGGVIITASDTEATGDLWSSSSPNGLIDGQNDCQMKTKWKSGAGQYHSIFIDLMKPIIAKSLSLTAPVCSGGSYTFYFYVYGTYDDPSTTSWPYWYSINSDTYGSLSFYAGQTISVNLQGYAPYKHYKIEFYGYQVELGELALGGCYEPNWHEENEASLTARLTRVFGSAGVGVGVIVGVCLLVLFVIVGVVIVIRRRKANAQTTTTNEEELQVINDNYHKM
jgi:hypothetical protein